MNPRAAAANFERLGNICATSAGLAPNHFASVAPYWSIAVVGIQRPWPPESSGPPSVRFGKRPNMFPPTTLPDAEPSPPTMK